MRGQTDFDGYDVHINPRYTGYCQECDYTFAADRKATVVAVLEAHQKEPGHSRATER